MCDCKNITEFYDCCNKPFCDDHDITWCDCNALFCKNCMEKDKYCPKCFNLCKDEERTGSYVYSGGRGEYKLHSKLTIDHDSLIKLLIPNKYYTIESTHKKISRKHSKLLSIDDYMNGEIHLTFEQESDKIDFIPITCLIEENDTRHWYTMNPVYIHQFVAVCIDDIYESNHK